MQRSQNVWTFSLRFLSSETMSENVIFNIGGKIGEIKIPYRIY